MLTVPLYLRVSTRVDRELRKLSKDSGLPIAKVADYLLCRALQMPEENQYAQLHSAIVSRETEGRKKS